MPRSRLAEAHLQLDSCVYDFASDRLDQDEEDDARVFDDVQWGSHVTNGVLVRDYLCAIISTEWKMSVSDDVAVRK